MHGDPIHAFALGQSRDLHRVQGTVVPAAADLDREAAGHGLAQRAEDDGGRQRIAHERGALALGHDLRDRAAHVEIDGVGAGRFQPAGGLGQHVGIGAEELHGQRPLLGQVTRQRGRLVVAEHERAGVDLLAGERAGAALATHEPERRVGDTGHRGQAQVQ